MPLVITGRQRGPVPGAGLRIALGGGVEADPGDLDERVAGVRVDGDPLPGPSLPQLSNSLESIGGLQQPGGVQHVGDRAGAVVAGSLKLPWPPPYDVGLVADLVAGPDRLLDRHRRERRGVGDAVDDLGHEAGDRRMRRGARRPRPAPEAGAAGAGRWRRRSSERWRRSPERRPPDAAGSADAEDAPASANSARQGQQIVVAANLSLSSAGGVSCRAGAKRACASRGFIAGLAPWGFGSPAPRIVWARGLGVAAIYTIRPARSHSRRRRCARRPRLARSGGPRNVRSQCGPRIPWRPERRAAARSPGSWPWRWPRAAAATKLLHERDRPTTSGVNGGIPSKTPQAAQKLGFPAVATKNTTRVAGADPAADAAGVALAVYPVGRRRHPPAAVALAPTDDWQAALAAVGADGAADPRPDPALRRRARCPRRPPTR